MVPGPQCGNLVWRLENLLQPNWLVLIKQIYQVLEEPLVWYEAPLVVEPENNIYILHVSFFLASILLGGLMFRCLVSTTCQRRVTVTRSSGVVSHTSVKFFLVVLQNYCPPAGPGRSLGIKNSEELYPLIMGIQYPFSEKW